MRAWRLGRTSFTGLRIVLAVAVLAACLSELPAWQARRNLVALPDYEFVANTERLLAQERLAEAVLVAQAGLESAPASERDRLHALLALIEARRSSLSYRLEAMATGALLGEAHTAWGLGGALVADLFVFGDVRDLLVQSTHAARGEPVDELLVGLSAVGLVTTVAPGADIGLGLLKAARRIGALSAGMVRRLKDMTARTVRRRDASELAKAANGVRRLADASDPATAMVLLRGVDDPAALPRMARFVERRQSGAFALWLGGGEAVAWLTRNGAHAGADLALAARKGRAGLRWLRAGGARLLHFHPLLGLSKGLYKGHWADFLVRLMIDRLPLLLGLSVLWLTLEVLRLLRPWRVRRPAII